MKFKVGDEVVRTKGVIDWTLGAYPLGSVHKIAAIGNDLSLNGWGWGYSPGPDKPWIITDCDFELYLPQLEND